MRKQLAKLGIVVSESDIKIKLEALKTKYMQEKALGNAASTWIHFERMAAVCEDHSMDFDLSAEEESSDGTFSSVYVDECASLMFNDESCREPPAKKTKCNSDAGQTKRKRKILSQSEELLFLEVWEKYARDLRGDRKKVLIHKDMSEELQKRGLQISPHEIKKKIESLLRGFRTQQDSFGSNSKWIHYAKVAEIVGHNLESIKFEETNSDSDTNWFNDDSKEIAEDDDKSPNHSSSFVELDPEDFEVDTVREDLSIQKREVQENPTSTSRMCKEQFVEQFGQFITKELSMLNEDLLIETKRRIYNFICMMQMKQLEINKRKQIN